CGYRSGRPQVVRRRGGHIHAGGARYGSISAESSSTSDACRGPTPARQDAFASSKRVGGARPSFGGAIPVHKCQTHFSSAVTASECRKCWIEALASAGSGR